MGTYQLILKRRTIRRFQPKAVPFSVLKKCVNAARLSPSARNTQQLEFIAVNDKKQVAMLNESVNFGGVVKEKGRVKGEEAKAFIAIIARKEKLSEYTNTDVGIAACAIVLTALEQCLGSCIMGSIQRERIKGVLGIPNEFEVSLVIALGFPKEKPVAEKPKGNDLFYWIDERERLHVPKRALEEVMHRNRF